MSWYEIGVGAAVFFLVFWTMLFVAAAATTAESDGSAIVGFVFFLSVAWGLLAAWVV